MSDTPRATGRVRTGISSEAAQASRAAAWAFAFQCFHRHKENEGGPETAPEDAERRSNEIGAKDIIPK